MDKDADSYLTVRLLNDESFGQMAEALEKLYTKTEKTPIDRINIHAIQILLSYNSIENQLFDMERCKIQDGPVEGASFVVDTTVIKARRLRHRLMNKEYVHVHAMHEEKPRIMPYMEFLELLKGEKYRLYPGTSRQADFTNREKFIEQLSKAL